MRWRSVVREVGLAMVAAGVAVLLFVAYELFGTNVAEQHSQAQLARQFSAAVSAAAAPRSPASSEPPASRPRSLPSHPASSLRRRSRASRPHAASRRELRSAGASHLATVSPPLPPPGGALDHLVIPAIGVDRYVVQGVEEADLQMGPGHYPGTPLPGQRGNVAIAGHRTTFGAPFFRLNELVRGDLVYLTDLSGTTWVYSVERQWVVAPTDVAVLGPTPAADLTLTTCNPRFLATSRLVVRALLVERLGRGAKLPGHLPVRLATSPTVRAAPPATGRPAPAKAGPVARKVVAHARGWSGSPSTATAAANEGRAATIATAVPTPTSGAGEGSPVVGAPAGGASAWTAALGWGAAAVAVWVATRLLANRRRRYAKVGVLLAGALVCLVPLWFAFGAAVDLLPANF